MPLWNWIECKAKSIAAHTRAFLDTLLARRDVAAVIIALLAPLSVMFLVSDANTVSVADLTEFATWFCGLTLGIAILVHGSGSVIGGIRSVISGKPILWNETVLSGITLFQSAYFLFRGYEEFVSAFRPYFYEITASSDPDTVSRLRILVLSEFVFLTSLTYYWAGMNRMARVINALEESYRNPQAGTIGSLVAGLSTGHRRVDSVLRLLTVIFLLIIQTKLNLSLFSSIDPSKLSTVKMVDQYAATAKTIAGTGGWFIILSLSHLMWDGFVWWHAKKRRLFVPTPWKLHRVTLAVSLFHYAFWRFGEAWVPRVPLSWHLAITSLVLFLSWKQLIFIIFAPHMSTLNVENRGGVT